MDKHGGQIGKIFYKHRMRRDLAPAQQSQAKHLAVRDPLKSRQLLAKANGGTASSYNQKVFEIQVGQCNNLRRRDNMRSP